MFIHGLHGILIILSGFYQGESNGKSGKRKQVKMAVSVLIYESQTAIDSNMFVVYELCGSLQTVR